MFTVLTAHARPIGGMAYFSLLWYSGYGSSGCGTSELTGGNMRGRKKLLIGIVGLFFLCVLIGIIASPVGMIRAGGGP